ncbi:MAG: aconitate hydratase [bacterium]
MGRSLTRKVLESHTAEGTWIPGETLAVRVQQVLTHDLLGPLVFLQFAALGLSRFKVELAATYADHSVFQVDPRMMRDHQFIRIASRKFGAYYSRPGAGICHQVHLERFAAPGKVLLGSDSHTPTAGGIGMIAIGAGGLDVTAALAGGPFRLPVPLVTAVHLTGRLSPWVTTKDVILELLRRLTVKGGVGKVFEFIGPGVRTLTVPERATLTNMSAELGATTAIFPSDEVTRDYLRRAGREAAWQPVHADPDADYDDRLEVDLAAIEPLVATPSMPDRVVPARDLDGVKVDQVMVGSCTNGSYVDILQVARILEGRAVHPDVELVINPSSKQSIELLSAEGWASRLMAAGANLSEATCGPCIGLAHIPAEGSVSLRTFNRNFLGRSGARQDRVYLASPVVAAIAAVTGEITDPRDWAAREASRGVAVSVPDVMLPDRFNLASHDIIPPASEDEARAIDLPITDDMVALPPLDPLPETLSARVVGVFGDDITTDDISPASGEALAAMTNLPLAAGFTFARLDPGFVERAKAAGIGVIVGGSNYGQGSSRENSAIAPRYLGVRAVIARSFARIHRANLINWGILPLVRAEDAHTLDLDDLIEFSNLREWLIRTGSVPPGGRSPVFRARAAAKGDGVDVQHDLNRRELFMVLSGGLFPSLRNELTES